MKLASFRFGDVNRVGIVEGGAITEINPTNGPVMIDEVLEHGQEIANLPHGEQFSVDDVSFLPVVPNAKKILCVGINYKDHANETGIDVPEHPSIFVRFADSVVGHGHDVVRPKVSSSLDFEGELAVIIGKKARYITESDALSYVAGYSCFAENSIRDFQFHSRQATPGKSFWRSGAFGPWMVTSDELPDPGSLDLTTRLNGEVMQSNNTQNMMFSVASLVSYISTFTELSVGDVISTGTPSGVGFSRDPKRYMAPGDTLEVEISGIGTLRHGVIDESDI